MPQLNRRNFVKLAGATSLAPALPTFSASTLSASTVTAAGTVGASGTASSQMLWASLYANSGNATGLIGTSQSLGISATSALNVCAKLNGSQIVLARKAIRLRTLARPAPISQQAGKVDLNLLRQQDEPETIEHDAPTDDQHSDNSVVAPEAVEDGVIDRDAVG